MIPHMMAVLRDENRNTKICSLCKNRLPVFWSVFLSQMTVFWFVFSSQISCPFFSHACIFCSILPITAMASLQWLTKETIGCKFFRAMLFCCVLLVSRAMTRADSTTRVVNTCCAFVYHVFARLHYVAGLDIMGI